MFFDDGIGHSYAYDLPSCFSILYNGSIKNRVTVTVGYTRLRIRTITLSEVEGSFLVLAVRSFDFTQGGK